MITATGTVIKVPHPDAREVGSASCFVHRDHLASIRVETDSPATATLRQRLGVPGAKVLIGQSAGCGGEDRGFVGERHEADTGLLDLNARWYNPTTGLFLTPDWLDPVDGDTARAGKPVGWRDNPVGTNLRQRV